MPPLESLGPRICILGPSNSGKSTLADAIERKLAIPAVHLDQLYHLPHTNWIPRPEADFVALHQAAIAQEQWVMEGNYTRHLAPRLERATGFIVLEFSTTTSLLRYFRRTLFERDRRGALEGSKDSVKWQMIRHIAIVTPPNRHKYLSIFEASALPKIRLQSTRELNLFYKREQLKA
ncbi:AAA family ATPase [Alcaligenes aquatilis]|uniref:AAA family ATPase n=1 Tax=Alcaligenes aquatilis TaxID=323284 RepID=A0ABY4NJV8_9BURK|nr:AAA family ATPase [Alcaligenes aquatilis]UQN37360.1 AAA family ATPase [Alcaligenes aquatilis]